MSLVLSVAALQLDSATGAVTMLLAPQDPSPAEEDRVLPVVIGPVEGAAVASARSGARAPRPQTHDLTLSLLSAAGSEIIGMEIVALIDGVFLSEVVLAGGRRVDSRTSDAVALALRAHAPIVCAPQVFEEAAVPAPSYLAQAGEMERFREFLQDVDPADFEDS